MAGEKEKKKVGHASDNPYDDGEIEEELMENDEIGPEEAGFMEGYNEKQKEKKKFRDILEDKH